VEELKGLREDQAKLVHKFQVRSSTGVGRKFPGR